MEYDVVIVGAGPAGLAAAIRLKQLAAEASASLGLRHRERLRGRRAYSVGRGVRAARARRAVARLARARRAARRRRRPRTASAARPSAAPCACRRRRRCTITATTSSASAISAAGWRSRPRRWASRSIPASPAPRCCTTATAASPASRPAPWASARTASRPRITSPASSSRAKETLFAEGCRGSLTKHAGRALRSARRHRAADLRLGIKELWEVEPAQHQPGPRRPHRRLAARSRAPMAAPSSIISRTARSRSASSSGSITRNPYLSPFEEFQRFKTHPAIRADLRRRAAHLLWRARPERGRLPVDPAARFPGGLLIGCAAGFMNVPKIKGSHTAMKSGMVAAETVVRRLAGDAGGRLSRARSKQSWLWPELHAVRNIRPGFRWGLWAGLAHAALDTYLFARQGALDLPPPRRLPGARSARATATPIAYPKPDGKITFDRLSSVFISNTNHEENQPPHLRLQGSGDGDRRQLRALRFAGAALLPGRRLRDRARRATASRACRSTPRIASTARPATSRTRRRTSTGWSRKAAAARIIRTCRSYGVECRDRRVARLGESMGTVADAASPDARVGAVFARCCVARCAEPACAGDRRRPQPAGRRAASRAPLGSYLAAAPRAAGARLCRRRAIHGARARRRSRQYRSGAPHLPVARLARASRRGGAAGAAHRRSRRQSRPRRDRAAASRTSRPAISTAALTRAQGAAARRRAALCRAAAARLGRGRRARSGAGAAGARRAWATCAASSRCAISTRR